MFIAARNVDSPQCISIMDTASSLPSKSDGTDSIDRMLQLGTYEAVATFLRQRHSQHTSDRSIQTIRLRSAYVLFCVDLDNRKSRAKTLNRATREQIVHAKNTSHCKRSDKDGHWYGDTNKESSLPNSISGSTMPADSSKCKPT